MRINFRLEDISINFNHLDHNPRVTVMIQAHHNSQSQRLVYPGKEFCGLNIKLITFIYLM